MVFWAPRASVRFHLIELGAGPTQPAAQDHKLLRRQHQSADSVGHSDEPVGRHEAAADSGARPLDASIAAFTAAVGAEGSTE